MQIIEITARDEGQRLDKFLIKYFKNASTGFLYKMLRKKNIVLNKKKAEGNEIIKDGDRISVFFSDETYDKMRGQDKTASDYDELKKLYLSFKPRIIYECDDYLAAYKPAGMLSQKSADADESINEYLLSYLINTGKLSCEDYSLFKPSIANRLDYNTEGLILFAKTLKGSQFLSKAVRERSIGKYYLCVASGLITTDISLDGYLKKDHDINKVEISFDITGEDKNDYDPIKTCVYPLYTDGANTLLEVELITGRSHQIRAHLAAIGHPIIGDMKYGNEIVNEKYKRLGVNRQLLIAYKLVIGDNTITVQPNDIYRKVIDYGDLEFQRT